MSNQRSMKNLVNGNYPTQLAESDKVFEEELKKALYAIKDSGAVVSVVSGEIMVRVDHQMRPQSAANWLTQIDNTGSTFKCGGNGRM